MAASVTSGFAAWQAALHAQLRQVQHGAEQAVEAAVQENKNVSDPLTPVRTGYLKSRNQTRIVERGPERFTGEYFNDAPYAIYVALGTRRMRARDFVTPGWAQGKRTYEARLRSIL